jgi:hypothetical protein
MYMNCLYYINKELPLLYYSKPLLWFINNQACMLTSFLFMNYIVCLFLNLYIIFSNIFIIILYILFIDILIISVKLQ